MRSEVKDVRPSQHKDGSFYGFIFAPDGGRDYYFTTQDIALAQPIDRGLEVEFEPIEEDGKRLARNVRPIEEIGGETFENISAKVVRRKQSTPRTLEDFTSNLVAQVESLSSVTDAEVFEDGVFLLLRLLGIHTIYQYPRSAQAGEADGFFMIESLAVMYDCTLRSNFESYKQTQIENYKNRLLQRTQLSFEFRRSGGGVGRKNLPLPAKKHVWIITKGKTREMEDFGGIKVKEISIADLCRVLENRIRNVSYDEEELATALARMGDA